MDTVTTTTLMNMTILVTDRNMATVISTVTATTLPMLESILSSDKNQILLILYGLQPHKLWSKLRKEQKLTEASPAASSLLSA